METKVGPRTVSLLPRPSIAQQKSTRLRWHLSAVKKSVGVAAPSRVSAVPAEMYPALVAAELPTVDPC